MGHAVPGSLAGLPADVRSLVADTKAQVRKVHARFLMRSTSPVSDDFCLQLTVYTVRRTYDDLSKDEVGSDPRLDLCACGRPDVSCASGPAAPPTPGA
jgi:hypothetical protein